MKIKPVLTFCAALFFCIIPWNTASASGTVHLRCPVVEVTAGDVGSNPAAAIAHSYRNAPPIFLAFLKADKKSFKNMLASGVSPDACGPDGSLLTLVASLDSSEYLTLLIKYKANLNLLNSSGDSPVSTALGLAKYDNAILLLQHGANPKVMDDFGRSTLLNLAVQTPANLKTEQREKQLLLANQLIKTGVDVNAQNKRGATALIVATIANNAALVNLLLKSDANPNLRYDKSQTARDYAEKKGFTEIAKLLLEAEELSKK
jgi:uncharacterized protein